MKIKKLEKKIQMLQLQNQLEQINRSKYFVASSPADVSDFKDTALTGMEYQNELQRQQCLQDIQEDEKLSYFYTEYLKMKKKFEKLNNKQEQNYKQVARAKEDAHISKERCKDFEKKLVKMEKQIDSLQRKIVILEKIADRTERIISGRDTKVSSKVVLRRMKDFERGTRRPMLPMKEHEKYIEARYVGEGRYE